MYTRCKDDVESLVSKSQHLHVVHHEDSYFIHGLSKDEIISLRAMALCEECIDVLDIEKERRISKAQNRYSSPSDITIIEVTDRSELLKDTKNQIFNLQYEEVRFENGADLVGTQPKEVKLSKRTEFGQFRLKK